MVNESVSELSKIEEIKLLLTKFPMEDTIEDNSPLRNKSLDALIVKPLLDWKHELQEILDKNPYKLYVVRFKTDKYHYTSFCYAVDETEAFDKVLEKCETTFKMFDEIIILFSSKINEIFPKKDMVFFAKRTRRP